MLTVQALERLVTGVWADLATEHGIVADAETVSPSGVGTDIALSGPRLTRTVFAVKRLDRPVRPSSLRQLAARSQSLRPEARLLAIVPAASPEARRVAEELGVSLLIAPAPMPAQSSVSQARGVLEGVLHTADGAVRLEAARPEPAQVRARGRVPWGTFAIAFALLEGPARDQSHLAAQVGVSRPRVSQVLTGLGSLVERTVDGWTTPDPRALADWLVDRYPSSPLLATTWATLDPPVRAAETVSRYLSELGVAHATSGEVAADRLAPWASPSTAWLWVAAPVDLQPAGMTPATAEAATVTLALSEDPHLLALARPADGLPVAPAWRVWVDLVHQGHHDAADALVATLVAGRRS